MFTLTTLKNGSYSLQKAEKTETNSKRLEAASIECDFYQNSVSVKPTSFKCIFVSLEHFYAWKKLNAHIFTGTIYPLGV